MAVDSKQGGTTNGTVGAATPSAPVTANGTGANPVARPSDNALPKRKRSSSLMKNAGALPTVEHSLEEFIAKANQTLVDVTSWEDAKEQDAKRKEQDAQRWKNAEVQMRESEAREASLRRQLDGLQGKLAEAEARAAVAGTQMGSAAHDTTISELKSQIDKAMQRMRAAEERSQELASEVSRLRAEGSARTPLPVAPGGSIDEGEAAERIRLAEAKAAKALAAARAAQAGLTVSPADLAAIESGLVVVDPPKKSSPVLPIALAFIGGLGIMFLVWKFVLAKETPGDTKPAPSASTATPVQVQPAPPAPPAPVAPSVTPIEEKPTPAATNDEPKQAPSVTPIEEDKAADKAVEEKAAKTEEAPRAEAKPEPKVEEKAAPVEPKVETKAAPKKAAVKAAPKAAPKTAPKAKKSTIADPFAETPAPKKEKKPAAEKKKPAGGIVDPF